MDESLDRWPRTRGRAETDPAAASPPSDDDALQEDCRKLRLPISPRLGSRFGLKPIAKLSDPLERPVSRNRARAVKMPSSVMLGQLPRGCERPEPTAGWTLASADSPRSEAGVEGPEPTTPVSPPVSPSARAVTPRPRFVSGLRPPPGSEHIRPNTALGYAELEAAMREIKRSGKKSNARYSQASRTTVRQRPSTSLGFVAGIRRRRSDGKAQGQADDGCGGEQHDSLSGNYVPDPPETLEATAAIVQEVADLERELKVAKLYQRRVAGMDTCSEIIPGLWLGGCKVLPPGVTHLLTLWEPDKQSKERVVPPLPFPEIPAMRRFVIREYDSFDVDLMRHFDEATSYMRTMLDRGEVVYAHCDRGASLSAAMVVAFLLRFRDASLLTAYSHTALRRDISCLNLGFLTQLGEYEKRLRGEMTLSLLDGWRTLVLHIEYDTSTILRGCADGDITKEWAKQVRGNPTDDILGRLLKSFRTFVIHLKGSGLCGSQPKQLLMRMGDTAALSKARR
eukprot:TRINITY_DN101595_c0_g1_i1.p1 TRINITY_DN101595_c0_g1~~TRINITY_DN101595_c0_g1_i1.p1  ORF type:complete len:509 (+),score=107.81 TRINITY_DN101595_c0_g1_i1:96-1622(+)